ncbi:MAG: major capsid protein [Aquincola sp.]|nr:major capsid protein [Aquincola sp.]
MAKAPFVVTPQLTAVAVAYRNSTLIADDVLPRVPVDAESFKYLKYPIGDFMTLTETRVGRKSAPNQVEFSGTEVTDSTVDHGLDDAVPQKDIDNAAAMPGMPDPQAHAAEGLTELIALAREVRTANLLFNAASYGAGNQVTLSGTSQWSDFSNSDPLSTILAAFDAMVMRPTIGVFGQATWTKLRTHPKICKAVFGNNTDAGVVSRRQVAELLELEDIFVGQGWLNTAKPGQAASMARVWGKHAAFLHRNKTAGQRRGTTFGFTAQWGSRVGGTISDPDIGLNGGVRVRVGERVKELITANDLGYYVQNAVA